MALNYHHRRLYHYPIHEQARITGFIPELLILVINPMPPNMNLLVKYIIFNFNVKITISFTIPNMLTLLSK